MGDDVHQHFQTLVSSGQPVGEVLAAHQAVARFLERAMSETRVSRANLLEKLRAAGVTDMASVRAVVLETTGDISVIRGDDLDDALMEGVSRVDRQPS